MLQLPRVLYIIASHDLDDTTVNSQNLALLITCQLETKLIWSRFLKTFSVHNFNYTDTPRSMTWTPSPAILEFPLGSIQFYPVCQKLTRQDKKWTKQCIVA